MQKTKHGLFFVFIAIAAVLIALLSTLPPASERFEEKPQLVPLNDGWYYIQQGEKVSVELPAAISYPGYDALVLYNDSLTQADAGLTVTMHGIEHGLSAYMNGKLLYDYFDDYFPRNDQMKSKYECDIVIPASSEVDVLELRFEHESSGEYKISPVYIG